MNNPFSLAAMLTTTQCEQCGARVTVLSPSESIACHCGTTERKVAHPAIAAVKAEILKVKKGFQS